MAEGLAKVTVNLAENIKVLFVIVIIDAPPMFFLVIMEEVIWYKIPKKYLFKQKLFDNKLSEVQNYVVNIRM